VWEPAAISIRTAFWVSIESSAALITAEATAVLAWAGLRPGTGSFQLCRISSRLVFALVGPAMWVTAYQ
jgi:hypothetical protein